MRITTKYTTTKSGAGRIVAKGAGKQHTQPYDHDLGIRANHGSAAGVLARKVLPQSEWQAAADRATHDETGVDSHVFTL